MIEFLKFNLNLKKIYKFLYQIKKQSITVLVFEFLIELFKINQACMLAIFVPQKCYIKNDQCNIDFSQPAHMCSLIENLKCLSTYNSFVLYYNFFTVLCFLILYGIEIYRELWLLDHFDYDEFESVATLESQKTNNNLLFTKLNYCNKIYFYSYIFTTIIYISNFMLSGALVLILNIYMNFTSITIFITSFLLCSNKILYGTYIAYISYCEIKPTSYYTKYYMTYNEIKIEHTRKFAEQLHGFFAALSHSDLSSFFKKNNVKSDIINEIFDKDIIVEVELSGVVDKNISRVSLNEKRSLEDFFINITNLSKHSKDTTPKSKDKKINLTSSRQNSIDRSTPKSSEQKKNLSRQNSIESYIPVFIHENLSRENSVENYILDQENIVLNNTKESFITDEHKSQKTKRDSIISNTYDNQTLYKLDNLNDLNAQQKRNSLIIKIDEISNNVIIKTPTHVETIPFNNFTEIFKNNNENPK